MAKAAPKKPKVPEVNDGLQFNDRIRASRVLLIDDKTKVGEMSLFDAIAHARTTGRDIVAVSPEDKPGPRVCKVVNKEAYRAEYRAKNDIVEFAEKKTMEISSAISTADLDTKLGQAQRMLAKQHPVQFTIKPPRSGSDLLQDKLLLETIITKMAEEAHEKSFGSSWLQRKLLLEPGKAKAPYVPIKATLPPDFVDPLGKKPERPKKFKPGKVKSRPRS